jgi:hypothetical protein
MSLASDVHVCESCGVPVPRWPDRERWPDRCTACNRERRAAHQRAYYEANRERLAAHKRAYYEANRERLAAYQRAYREANRERRAAVTEASGACPWCAVGQHDACAGGACTCHGAAA